MSEHEPHVMQQAYLDTVLQRSIELADLNSITIKVICPSNHSKGYESILRSAFVNSFVIPAILVYFVTCVNFCMVISRPLMTTTAPAAAMTRGLHPLPPGWTEHTAPTGHKYYYNASLKKSTYQRPMIEATQTPPTPPIAQQPLSTQPTSASRIEQVVPLTEWSAEVRPQQDDQPEEKQTGRVQGQDMWALLEDRPRKKCAPSHHHSNNPGSKSPVQNPGSK